MHLHVPMLFDLPIVPTDDGKNPVWDFPDRAYEKIP